MKQVLKLTKQIGRVCDCQLCPKFEDRIPLSEIKILKYVQALIGVIFIMFEHKTI